MNDSHAYTAHRSIASQLPSSAGSEVIPEFSCTKRVTKDTGQATPDGSEVSLFSCTWTCSRDEHEQRDAGSAVSILFEATSLARSTQEK